MLIYNGMLTNMFFVLFFSQNCERKIFLKLFVLHIEVVNNKSLQEVCFFIELCNKKAYKYNCKLREKIKNGLPKGTKFSVNVTDLNNKDLNKLLKEKLTCTALFDGNTVTIEFSLPEKVSLETDDVLWFNDNFKY